MAAKFPRSVALALVLTAGCAEEIPPLPEAPRTVTFVPFAKVPQSSVAVAPRPERTFAFAFTLSRWDDASPKKVVKTDLRLDLAERRVGEIAIEDAPPPPEWSVSRAFFNVASRYFTSRARETSDAAARDAEAYTLFPKAEPLRGEGVRIRADFRAHGDDTFLDVALEIGSTGNDGRASIARSNASAPVRVGVSVPVTSLVNGTHHYDLAVVSRPVESKKI